MVCDPTTIHQNNSLHRNGPAFGRCQAVQPLECSQPLAHGGEGEQSAAGRQPPVVHESLARCLLLQREISIRIIATANLGRSLLSLTKKGALMKPSRVFACLMALVAGGLAPRSYAQTPFYQLDASAEAFNAGEGMTPSKTDHTVGKDFVAAEAELTIGGTTARALATSDFNKLGAYARVVASLPELNDMMGGAAHGNVAGLALLRAGRNAYHERKRAGVGRY